MPAPLRLVWSSRALRDLERISDRSPKQVEAVVEAMEKIAASGFPHVGAEVRPGRRYWSVTPHGIYYAVRGRTLTVTRVVDVRRRRTSRP